jgi:putative glutamine amidotransferase
MTHPPLIGLNSDVLEIAPGRHGAGLHWPYVQALKQAGAIPLLIPPTTDPRELDVILGRLEGLVLTGGWDLPPAWYGQEAHPRTRLADPRRLEGDRWLAQAALEHDLPLLGICLGCQLLNVLLGGDLVQDIPSQVDTEILHAVPPPSPEEAERLKQGGPEAKNRPIETFHQARIQPGSRLAAILGKDELEVNSSHHQAVGRPGNGLQPVAWAPDGVIEALEGAGPRFLLALQWHPERLFERPDHLIVFQALVEETRGE